MSEIDKFKVGILFSHDYKLLKVSIPLIYNYSDEIWLAKDIDNLTWSGETFEIKDSFFEWLNKIDVDNKIHIYEDKFYFPDMSLPEKEVYERKKLAEKMGQDFCFQMDPDEFYLDFKSFKKDLMEKNRLYENASPVQFCTYLIPIFKKTENGYLVVSHPESFYTATTKVNYFIARKNKNQRKVYLPHLCLHQSWGRSRKDLELKINSWAHKYDFDRETYMKFWESIDENNYKSINDFHPFIKGLWKKLDYYPAKDINELTHMIDLRKYDLKNKCFWKNFGQKMKFLFK